MTRYFYEYQAPEPVEEIAVRLHELELDIQSSLDALFGRNDMSRKMKESGIDWIGSILCRGILLNLSICMVV